MCLSPVNENANVLKRISFNENTTVLKVSFCNLEHFRFYYLKHLKEVVL